MFVNLWYYDMIFVSVKYGGDLDFLYNDSRWRTLRFCISNDSLYHGV